jgi:hypothetical protein
VNRLILVIENEEASWRRFYPEFIDGLGTLRKRDTILTATWWSPDRNGF